MDPQRWDALLSFFTTPTLMSNVRLHETHAQRTAPDSPVCCDGGRSGRADADHRVQVRLVVGSCLFLHAPSAYQAGVVERTAKPPARAALNLGFRWSGNGKGGVRTHKEALFPTVLRSPDAMRPAIELILWHHRQYALCAQ